MFDSLTIAHQLTEANIERAQADVLADAIRQAAEHGEHVMPETLRTEVATRPARSVRSVPTCSARCSYKQAPS